MNELKNELGQSIGWPVVDWRPATWPRDNPLLGNVCRLEAFNGDKHVQQLYDAFVKDSDGYNWTYLPYGPFESVEAFRAWTEQTCYGQDPKFYTIVDQQSNQAVGVASYLRIDPNAGVIEVGHIHFSPLLQGTTLATEAMYLMMKQVFDWGYRRYEWKCDNLNEPSKKAALRLGFFFEGVFRQAVMYKGRNRDTAWFAIVDKDWLTNQHAFESWLATDNFDEAGRQTKSLADFRT